MRISWLRVSAGAGSISRIVRYRNSNHHAKFHAFIINFNNSGHFGTIAATLSLTHQEQSSSDNDRLRPNLAIVRMPEPSFETAAAE